MSDNDGPLSDLHILDLSSFVAGPSCTLTLGQLGADVLRIDPVGGAPDAGRHPLGGDGSSLYWAGLNKQKRCTTLDLASEDGRDTVRRLLGAPGPGHGIVVTNAVGRGWLSYESLRSVRDDLIMVRLEGRSDGTTAVDYTVNCETGLPELTGPSAWQGPVNSVLPSWDLLAGLQAATSLLAAVRRRERSGGGALLQLSLTDVAASTMAHLGYVADAAANGTRRQRDGNSIYGSYGQDFPLGDGSRIMLVALTSRHWRNLLAVTGCEQTAARLEAAAGASLADEGVRYRLRSDVTRMLSPWFSTRGLDEVAGKLDAAGLPWGVYRTANDMATSPHGLVARSEIFTEVEHPGVGRYPVPGAAVRAPWRVPLRPRPEPAHAAVVAEEWVARGAAPAEQGVA
ncbi:2-methylfumaryl-CoA isomerase [Nakamurella sp. YIM 132087]|uniref:2-methylfumaryl-CoA isomerase n=1 Tax=Nakamurella alba TaxID=2665158 RepID=A0A7K1FE95_9ACTN|nr:CoA transferase [Nakamurella alba]MTD12411.1 2-methylfumaryl-CoA isomerase [Nakamurella alba]